MVAFLHLISHGSCFDKCKLVHKLFILIGMLWIQWHRLMLNPTANGHRITRWPPQLDRQEQLRTGMAAGCPKQCWSLSCCSLNFVTRCPMNKKSSLVKMMTWHQIGDETLLNLIWPCCLIDGLAWPGDAIWRLAQVMAWCLTTPSHYLNQCWLVIRKVQWESPGGNFTRNISVINHKN